MTERAVRGTGPGDGSFRPPSAGRSDRPPSTHGADRPLLLEVRDVESWYGPLRALSGISFHVEEGSVTVILGGNGAGKSTLLNTIMGVLPEQPSRGAITFGGTRIDGAATERIVRAGVAYVPEGRRVFAELSVRDNLAVGAYVRRDRAAVRRSLERVYEYFPLLAERHEQPAGTLSGGEQQMLAIGRALMSGPRLLLLDEPSLGLAPILVHQVFDIIEQIRSEGVTVLLVEQNARMALTIADRGLVLEHGELVVSGAASELVDNEEVEELYMGSSAAPPDTGSHP